MTDKQLQDGNDLKKSIDYLKREVSKWEMATEIAGLNLRNDVHREVFVSGSYLNDSFRAIRAIVLTDLKEKLAKAQTIYEEL